MARQSHISYHELTTLIRARGPVSATELAALLKVDRTTIVRKLPELGNELVTLGATRSTRYVLRRAIRNSGNRWPVYRIGEDGKAREWAELEAFHDSSWRVIWQNTPPEWARLFTEENGLWSGFPFFLADVRPQGFLGRAIASRISRALRLPEDPRYWSDEDIIVYLQAEGEDLTGNLVVGDDCLRRALARSSDRPEGRVMAEQDRENHYPEQAVNIAMSLPGSSAGGEQPKFLTTLRQDVDGFLPVLVKFSAPVDQEVGRRWADLLLCEFHAHQVLAEVGLANPGARLLDAGGRRFLEVPRFDREGEGGRRGVVSLEALASSLTGVLSRNWGEAVSELHEFGLIDGGSQRAVQRLQAFGELIGNTDMHFGNLGFFLGDALPLRVAPSYDMLPMLWAPGIQGEIIERRFAPVPPLPSTVEPWREATEWAETFWERVIADTRLSSGFIRIARSAQEVVRQLRGHVG